MRFTHFDSESGELRQRAVRQKRYGYVVYDREGAEIAWSDDDELFLTAAEADAAGEFHIDDPRYGSHDIEEHFVSGGSHGAA